VRNLLDQFLPFLGPQTCHERGDLAVFYLEERPQFVDYLAKGVFEALTVGRVHITWVDAHRPLMDFVHRVTEFLAVPLQFIEHALR
jgi:hypothetical protein